jgi:hypothetical protein
LKRLDRWLFSEYAISAESLALFRILFAGFLVLYLPDFRWVAELPDELYQPALGPMMLLSGFPSPEMVALAQWGLWISIASLGLGLFPRSSSIATGLLMCLLYGFTYATEKPHHHSLTVLLPLILSQSNWGCRYALTPNTPHEKRNSWALATLALAVGFVFLTAALPKLLGGWLDPSTQGAYSHIVGRGVARQNVGPWLPWALNHPGFLWELADYGTVALELGVLAAAVRQWLFRIALCFATFLHLGIWGWMGVRFGDQVLVYGAFVNWFAVGRWLAQLPLLARVSVIVPAGLIITRLFKGNWNEGLLLFGGTIATVYLLRVVYRKIRGAESTLVPTHVEQGSSNPGQPPRHAC